MIDRKLVGGYHVMIKPRGAMCNLACKYCYYLEKENLFTGSCFKMSDELLEIFTRQQIESTHSNQVTFTWQGGEPTLMGIEFYQRAIRLQQMYRRPGMIIENVIQTNGIAINNDWCEFFRQSNFLVGISIDGPRELHDIYRLDKRGRPTFDKVIRGLEIIKRHGVNFNVLTAVHSGNVNKSLDVYRFLRDEIGTKFIQFIPIVEPNREWSVNPNSFGEFLTSIFDEWVRNDIGKIFVQLFDGCLEAWMGRLGGLCIFAPVCGRCFALEHNGTLYSCDHYVDIDHLIGNIRDTHLYNLVNSSKATKFGLNKYLILPNSCQQCEFLFACYGGCPKDRNCNSPEGEPGTNYLCSGYKTFFNHINAPMKLMASLLNQGRSPAEVKIFIDYMPQEFNRS